MNVERTLSYLYCLRRLRRLIEAADPSVPEMKKALAEFRLDKGEDIAASIDLQVLDAAPVLWEGMADAMSDEERREASDELAALASRAALAARYFGSRNIGHTHAQSVKAAQGTLAAVRKKLGFAYPAAATFPF